MRKLREPLNVPDSEQTKSKILMEAARMFAVSGYSTVTIRDIAKVIGIQPGSIYAHFNSKQDILDSIMQMCEKEIEAYYEMIEVLSYEAKNFSELLGNLFVESMEVVNPFSYYALYSASTNQFEFESCRHLYYDIYFQKGHQIMCRQLEIAIERGLVKPFDVRAIGSLITNCILNLVSITVGILNGFHKDFDTIEWYGRTTKLILRLQRVNRRIT